MVLYVFLKISKCTINFENQCGQPVFIGENSQFSNQEKIGKNSLKESLFFFAKPIILLKDMI